MFDYKVVSAPDLSEQNKILLSDFIYSMDDEYYRVFGSKDEVVICIKSAIDDPLSEFYLSKCFFSDGVFWGFLVFYDSSELFRRRVWFYNFLFKKLRPKIIDRNVLIRFTVSIPDDFDSCYISKIFVAPSCRGKGLSNKLVDWLVQNHSSNRRDLALNVSVDNHVAIALYKKHDFVFHGMQSVNYHFMVRSLC